MQEALVLASPVLAAVVAAVPLLFFSPAWLVRISTGSFVTQVCLLFATWIVLGTTPGEQNWREPKGSTCPNFDSFHGDVLVVLAFASVGVGAVALASGVLSWIRRAATFWRVLLGAVAVGFVYAIGFTLLISALCGIS
jgi:hypothetical protein